jgi:hypothetical protein
MPSNSKSFAITAAKPKTNRSPAQTEASRRNGAKSRGPITAEGKARAAQNALRHGLTDEGTTVLLRHESQSMLEQLRLAYYTQFQPSNPVEIDLVDEMIAARWRIRRYTEIESRLLELPATAPALPPLALRSLGELRAKPPCPIPSRTCY